MKYTQSNVRYDAGADIAYVELTEKIGFGEIADTVILGESIEKIQTTIAIDFDKNGKVIGIEIDDASKRLREDFLEKLK